MTLPEAGGVAWTKVYTPEGQEIVLTARGENLNTALDELMETLKYAKRHKLFDRPGNGRGTTKPKPVQKSAPPPPEFEDSNEDPFGFEENEELEEPILGRDWGLVDRKPKASELGFGDRYEIPVDEYKFGEGSIKFYVTGLQYPILTHNMTNEYAYNKFNEIFKGWEPVSDNEQHPIPKGAVILAVQCTGPDKQTKQGNPYQNLDGMRRA